MFLPRILGMGKDVIRCSYLTILHLLIISLPCVWMALVCSLFQTDGGQWTLVPKVTATCVGNAEYFGGGMKITPTADPFNGRLEVRELIFTRHSVMYDPSHF